MTHQPSSATTNPRRPFHAAVRLASFCAILALLTLSGSAQAPGATPAGGPPIEGRIAPYDIIDAHVHVFVNSPAYLAMLERVGARAISVCLVDRRSPAYSDPLPQFQMSKEVVAASRGRLAWLSTFDPEEFESPAFTANTTRLLDQTFQDGAVGVKIYKTIGLAIKGRDGKYLLPDNPAFDKIFDHIAARKRMVFAHIAEPIGAWNPLDPADPDYNYYRTHPNEHIFLNPGPPAKNTILAARDAMLAKHPNLTVLGCHLGSMEDNVDEVAKRFDAYPNFIVDTAARIRHLKLQPRDKVRAFLIKYQDRVLYATDVGLRPGADIEGTVTRMERTYRDDWTYLATDQMVSYGDRQMQGLALPDSVLRKIYRENALRWIPGAFQE
jgi:hypothetical protein